MPKKHTSSKNGQIDKYVFYEKGEHEHFWYDSKTGKMGYHAEKTSKEEKKYAGNLARERMEGVTNDSYRNVVSLNRGIDMPLQNKQYGEGDRIMSIYSARKKSRVLDRTIIKEEGTKHEKRIEELHELGEKFREDKEKWEKAYEEIEADDTLDSKEKAAQLRVLKSEIQETQEQYEERVKELEQEELEEMQGNIDEMTELAEKLDNQAARLEGLKKEVDSSGTDAAAEAQMRAEKARAWVTSQVELQQARIEKFKEQARKINNNKF